MYNPSNNCTFAAKLKNKIMAAIALIFRKMTSEQMLQLGELGYQTKLTQIGKDIFFKHDGIDWGIREFHEGTTEIFLDLKIDVNHIVHDCGDDFDLFVWGVQNPLKFYNWQYKEREYDNPKMRKESLKNDKFKIYDDKLKKVKEDEMIQKLKEKGISFKF